MNHGGPHRDVFRSIGVKKIAICDGSEVRDKGCKML